MVLFLACFAYLEATDFRLFTFLSLFGLETLPKCSFSQMVAFNLMGLLSYPLAPVVGSVESTVLLILLLVGNYSIICIYFAAGSHECVCSATTATRVLIGVGYNRDTLTSSHRERPTSSANQTMFTS